MATMFKVKDISPRCLTEVAGRRLLSVIKPELVAKNDILVDFEGITMFASLFFNNSFAELLRDLSPEYIDQHVKVLNLNEAGRRAFQRSMDNAVEYFKLELSQKEKIENIVDTVSDQR